MAWRKILIWGAVASAAAVGCKVTVNEGPIDGGFEDSGSGGSSAGGGSSGGSSGSGGKATGGEAGTGGASGSSGSSGSGGSMRDAGMDSGMDGAVTSCTLDMDSGPCATCIETKCCQEWLDCVNDADCLKMSGSKPEEYYCIQDCLVGDSSGLKTLDDCAGECAHDTVGISAATSNLIGCMRDMGDSATTQNCTQQCFQRDLPQP